MNPLAVARFAIRLFALDSISRDDPEQVADLRERRLRSLLRRAVERSAFYREKFRGIDVSRCPLSELPTTKKAEMMEHFDGVVTDPAVRRADLEAFLDDPARRGQPFLGRYAASHTSGSQGQPLLILQDQDCLELLFALQCARGNRVTPVTPLAAARRLFEPVRLAVVLMKEGIYPSVAAFDHMPDALRSFVQILRLAPTDADLIDRLNEFRPNVLMGYASVLETLAVAGTRLRLASHLRQVINSSEMLTEHARILLRQAFAVPILDTYGCGECLFLSNGCPAGPGSHINADWVIVEVVDETGRMVPPGTLGHKVLLTNLANTVQPFIRYEIGDRIALDDSPCACGSRLPRVARIEGRSADVIWVKDGARYRPIQGEVFLHAFDYAREVREWQAVQEERNRVRVRLEMVPGAEFNRDRAERMLRQQLQMFDLDGLLEVDLETVPALANDPQTGKFQRIVSLGGPPRKDDVGSGAAPRHTIRAVAASADHRPM
jgi:phenylacetate-coenzyme A ligase PaaK-like adenylate-forming protein